MVTEGDRAPQFTLPADDGTEVSLSDFAGARVVLYFYPKDDTPGCTKEACDFRDHLEELSSMGAVVLGVSADSISRHQKFSTKYDLNFRLLSDTDHEVMNAYGVWQLKKLYGRESMGIVRSSFLIDESGVIRRAWRKVRVHRKKGDEIVHRHVDDVREALTQLG